MQFFIIFTSILKKNLKVVNRLGICLIANAVIVATLIAVAAFNAGDNSELDPNDPERVLNF